MSKRTVLSARSVRRITPIDGGDTLVVEFDGATVDDTHSLLIPAREMDRFGEQLSAALAEAASMKLSRRPGPG